MKRLSKVVINCTTLPACTPAHSNDFFSLKARRCKSFSEQPKVTGSLSVPLVVSTRIEDGMITQKSLICKNTVAANNLQPQKAAVLLRLALTITKDHDELVRIFSTY